MKKVNIWCIMCICGLILSGCGNKTSSQSTQQTQQASPQADQPEATEAIQSDAEPSSQAGESDSEQPEGAQSDAAPAASKSSSTQTTAMTEQQALDAALSHAGVKESDLTSKRIKKEWENGEEVYDVEFYANGTEYDYEISTADGRIVKSDQETKNNAKSKNKSSNSGNSNSSEITEQEAKRIALAKVPGAQQIDIKKDIEDGRTVYEGEIHHEKKEYEFEIDAVTGKILKWEED